MPAQIDIDLRGRWLRRRIRRDLPASWSEVPQARRLPLLRLLIQHPGAAGRLKAIRALLHLPGPVWRALDDDQLTSLLDAAPWLDLNASNPEPILTSFRHGWTIYHAPKGHGLNLVALEYPIADEAFTAYVMRGDERALHLLLATLYRPRNPDAAARTRRGDERAPLLSRWQAEQRADQLKGAPQEALVSALLYFAGVKEFVARSYATLFEQPDDQNEDSAEERSTQPSLGWWAVYFNVAVDGPFGRNVEEVYQTSFHDICLYLVERKRQEERAAMQSRLHHTDFGQPNNQETR